MLEFQKKKKIRKIIYSPITLIILSLLFFLLAKAVLGVYSKEKISYQNLIKEKNDLEKIMLREKNLVTSIEYLKTEEGIEKEIRTKFRAVRENEKVAVIIDENPTSTTQISTTTKRGFWSKLFGRD